VGPLLVVTVLTVLTLWSGSASAHVTVSPATLPQGAGDAVLTFRVPNESATATVTALRIEFPLSHPIALVNPEAGSGWTVTVRRVALRTPVRTDDGTFTSTVSEIDWTHGAIPVGQFAEFNVLAQGLPTGISALVFKAVQQYSDGTTVAWIEVPNRVVPDPAHPAPVLTLTAPHRSTGGTSAATATPQGPVTAVTPASGDALAVTALILGCFAVLLALLAVWLGRPRAPSPPHDEPAQP
jgi:uncharacterized protein YcnI